MRIYKKTASFAFRAAFCCLATAMLLGCAGIYVDPGPQPARLRLLLQANSDMAEVEAAMANKIRGYYYGFDTFGPYWEWGLYLKRSDGSLQRLRPAQEDSVKTEKGFSFDREVVFLVPPGSHNLWLLLDVYLDYYEPNWGGSVVPVTIKTYTEDIKVDICPNCVVEIKRLLGKFQPRVP